LERIEYGEGSEEEEEEECAPKAAPKGTQRTMGHVGGKENRPEKRRRKEKKKMKKRISVESTLTFDATAGGDDGGDPDTETEGEVEDGEAERDCSAYADFETLRKKYEEVYENGTLKLTGLEGWLPIVKDSKFVMEGHEVPTKYHFNRPAFEYRDGSSAYTILSDKYLALKPGDLLVKLLMQNGFLADICKWTNAMAPEGWKAVTQGELVHWIGLQLSMSLVHFWEEKYHFQKGSQGAITFPDLGRWGMSLSRMQSIRQRLKLADYSQVNPDREKQPHWKVLPTVQKARATFNSILPEPTGELSIDEAMLRCQGRCPIKVYMPNKPIKVGIKLYMVTDYTTGLCVDFDVEAHQYNKETYSHLSYGCPGLIVMKLAEKFLHRHRTLFVDNYYTSVPLARALLEKATYLVGTVRKDRVDKCAQFPDNVMRPTTRCPRGTVNLSMSMDRQVALVGFMDNKACYLLDTKSGFVPANVVRKNKDGEGQSYPMLESINLYGQWMGGVDQFDQLRTARYGTLSMMAKRIKWTIKVFEAIVDMYIANAFRIYCYLHPEEKMTRGKFILTLQECLVDRRRYGTLLDGILSDTPATRSSVDSCASMFSPTSTSSSSTFLRPTWIGIPGSRPDQPNSKVGRKKCSVCFAPGVTPRQPRTTSWMCSACNRAVCRHHPECLDIHLSHAGADERKLHPYCPKWKDPM
jgi:hypothetical protein